MTFKLNKREKHWLKVAKNAGYERGFFARDCEGLRNLESKN